MLSSSLLPQRALVRYESLQISWILGLDEATLETCCCPLDLAPFYTSTLQPEQTRQQSVTSPCSLSRMFPTGDM